jgi:hypothetical protein
LPQEIQAIRVTGIVTRTNDLSRANNLNLWLGLKFGVYTKEVNRRASNHVAAMNSSFGQFIKVLGSIGM